MLLLFTFIFIFLCFDASASYFHPLFLYQPHPFYLFSSHSSTFIVFYLNFFFFLSLLLFICRFSPSQSFLIAIFFSPSTFFPSLPLARCLPRPPSLLSSSLTPCWFLHALMAPSPCILASCSCLMPGASCSSQLPFRVVFMKPP